MEVQFEGVTLRKKSSKEFQRPRGNLNAMPTSVPTKAKRLMGSMAEEIKFDAPTLDTSLKGFPDIDPV
jgi:hypothetical protein